MNNIISKYKDNIRCKCKDNIKIRPRYIDCEEVNGLNGLSLGSIGLMLPC